MDQERIYTAEQAEAARILLARRQARADLNQWGALALAPMGQTPARHHRLLNEKLMDVVKGKIRRLMVFMPPGSAKSSYGSVLFPPWFLAQQAYRGILCCSHNAELAASFGRRSRNLITEYSKVLGYDLKKDSAAADKWESSNGGFYLAAGVGAGIAGRRADLGVIDDPVGSREDAYSKIIQERNWNWYRNDFEPRLKPGASVVIIQTRWHEEDLSGKLLKAEPSNWEVISLPMIAKDNDPLGRPPGELLWGEWFGSDPLILQGAQSDKTKWSALYQQDPTPEDGDYFKREWIEKNWYEASELPPLSELTVYCASDHAVSLKETADSTCMLAAGVDERGVIWILPDLYWNRCDAMEAVQQMIGMMKRLNPLTWWAENEKITKSIGPFLEKAKREAGVYNYVEPVHPAKDKMTRAQSIRGRMQAGMVRFPKQAPWLAEAILQMLKFPAGAHDDFIDPLAYIGLGLDRMASGSVTPVVNYPPLEVEWKPTMKWIKDSASSKERAKELALRDR